MINAPSRAAALAVANPNPEVPPISTTRCPFKVRLRSLSILKLCFLHAL
jgi:hypothetical protein